ncbi:MAG: hypothetical protein JO053_08700 [Acidobacteria bacterium]|nr:hypothetical protein [Acidobacteriota bacterium]
MAIVVRFTPNGMTAAKYDEIINRLRAVGAGSPAGRTFHVCFGDPNNLKVSDIWDSHETFAKFGETLMPILGELGVDPGSPEIVEVHNTIIGERTSANAG